MGDEQKNNRRVVVTGLGVVSSLGIGWEEFWRNLLAGKSGISRITAFDISQHDRCYGGEIKNFDASEYIPKRKLAQMGRASQFAIVASQLALKDSKLTLGFLKNEKAGVCIGTTMGEAQVIEQMVKHTIVNKERLKQIRALIYPANSISINVAGYFKFRGVNAVFANACAAGTYAIGRAYDLIRSGKSDIMLAGGADALSRIALTGFGRLYAMAPEKCQPFDKNRKGMLIGEGSGMIVLESLENALNRNAPIYAEIAGYGLSCDAHDMTYPSVGGVASGIKKALRSAKINNHEVDYISAHGTGTKENDKAECEALYMALGKGVERIPVSSIKSMLGHTMGAASALETIACCLAIKFNAIPPTINLLEQDPECRIDCVPNQGRQQEVRVALNNSQAFGGNNACLILGECSNE